ncbi:hypothetical protein SAMN05660649_04918 [Desulfotomaculum arcticum]|uniref:Uncharacterized protein n=1 Tax=Desulfotruncus arcticus DSM 17038 TaxID=1121424 RepID=A0A1I2ZHC4_9FIRM|nr:hypothetical protein SAMN05660649_04918 [Desulfotomaculum arcticum] [Desulfotruncus arcticus DSM 17038]
MTLLKNYFFVLLLNIFFIYFYQYISQNFNAYATAFVRFTWIIIMLKVLPKYIPSIDNFFNLIEKAIKKLLNRPLLILVNKWLSYKNICIVLVVSSVVPFIPIIIIQILTFFRVPIYGQLKDTLLWILNLVSTYIDYYLWIPVIILFILLMKMATSYIAKRTLLLLETKKKNSFQFYLFAALFIIIEEIFFAASLLINNKY